MENIVVEIIMISHSLKELHALHPDHPTLLCDNHNALFLSQNLISHKQAKHIDIGYHFIREHVDLVHCTLVAFQTPCSYHTSSPRVF